jgi:hypothetical protein
MTDYPPANAYGQVPIGIKNGEVVYVTEALIAQKGIKAIKDALGLTRRYPVKTSLSGDVLMVEANSHEEAVKLYLSRSKT